MANTECGASSLFTQQIVFHSRGKNNNYKKKFTSIVSIFGAKPTAEIVNDSVLEWGGSALRNTAVLSDSVSTLTGCLWDPRSILSIMLASPVG